jgi:hypothetical protein
VQNRVQNKELTWPANTTQEVFVAAIDRSIAGANLHTTMRGTLKKFPGCIHWHVKQGRASGTLEITVLPKEMRAWFTVQSGRTATWIEEQIEQLAKLIEQSLRDAE